MSKPDRFERWSKRIKSKLHWATGNEISLIRFGFQHGYRAAKADAKRKAKAQ